MDREPAGTLAPETQIVATHLGRYGAMLLSPSYRHLVARCESPVSFWELVLSSHRSPASLNEAVDDLRAQGVVSVYLPDECAGHSSEVLRRIIRRLAALS
jgi:hypothetical protein